jgi:hypothetical protein
VHTRERQSACLSMSRYHLHASRYSDILCNPRPNPSLTATIMPSTKRTAYNGPPLSGPGIIWTASKLEATDKVPPELFKKWYETVHIPEIIAVKPGGVVAASRYQCMDPERAAPYLAVYSLPDLGYLQTPEFKSVSMSDPMLPEGGPVHKFVAFDTRFYQRVQVVERPGASKERAPILISAAIDPAEGTEQDFNEWYEKEASIARQVGDGVANLCRSICSSCRMKQRTGEGRLGTRLCTESRTRTIRQKNVERPNS